MQALPSEGTVALAGGAAALIAAGAATTYGIIGRSSRLFGPSVYRGSTRQRRIALTFDDGPSPSSLRLLDYLDRESVPATFFHCGMNVERHPEIAQAIVSAGHEIGNHTYSHQRLVFKSTPFMTRELERAQVAIEAATGFVPRYFRAPYGHRWFGIGTAQRKFNLLGVMWTVIGQDWKLPAPEIARRVISKASPGAIVCLHDGRGVRENPAIAPVLEALREIIPSLKNQGYLFSTVTDLLRPA
jgi:peptidoglycan/xylan/chitin deacetylase (PgdA/CDA1 family)